MKVITLILQMSTLRLESIHSFFPQTFIKNDMMGGQGGSPCKADLVMIINGQHAFLKGLRNTVLMIKDKAERQKGEIKSSELQ